MNQVNTLRDLFRHSDWAGQRVLEGAARLPDEQLDREFPMGFATLRKTLWHIYGAEHIWMQRLRGQRPTRFAPEEDRPSLPMLQEYLARTTQRRNALLDSLTDSDVGRDVAYKDMKGNAHTSRMGHILLHVCNHGAHHRAQAINMIRHARPGDKPLRLDYLFMYFEDPNRAAPNLSVDLLREYFDYTDWGRDRVLKLIDELDDTALDRPFEMGIGSIRRNMVHTLAAETFWLRNWMKQTGHAFPAADEPLSTSELKARFTQIGSDRNRFLAGTTDADLLQPVSARTPDGREFAFPLGVTALQLCGHGTHHRAQTINMLRQCGKITPPTDFIVKIRES